MQREALTQHACNFSNPLKVSSNKSELDFCRVHVDFLFCWIRIVSLFALRYRSTATRKHIDNDFFIVKFKFLAPVLSSVITVKKLLTSYTPNSVGKILTLLLVQECFSF
jgi:hypothetical protein